MTPSAKIKLRNVKSAYLLKNSLQFCLLKTKTHRKMLKKIPTEASHVRIEQVSSNRTSYRRVIDV